MTLESIVRAWHVGTTNVKGWLFAMPTSPSKVVVESVKGWSVKGW